MNIFISIGGIYSLPIFGFVAKELLKMCAICYVP